MENVLGVQLIVETFFQSEASGINTVSLSYVAGENISADPLAAFTEMVEELAGEVSFSLASAGGATLTFEGITVNEFTADGSFTLSGNQIAAILIAKDQ